MCGKNAARYITEYDSLVCGLCPIKYGIDAIKISDVAKLLRWARQVSEGGMMNGSSFEALRSIIGRHPGRQYITLDDVSFARFSKAIENPAPPTPALVDLFRKPE
jgi:hypothetical protein